MSKSPEGINPEFKEIPKHIKEHNKQKAVDIANRYDIEDEETLEELTSSST